MTVRGIDLPSLALLQRLVKERGNVEKIFIKDHTEYKKSNYSKCPPFAFTNFLNWPGHSSIAARTTSRGIDAADFTKSAFHVSLLCRSIAARTTSRGIDAADFTKSVFHVSLLFWSIAARMTSRGIDTNFVCKQSIV